MGRVFEFNGYTYTEVALDRCRSLALGLNEQGKKWHSHVLSPGCRLNPFRNRYAIVVEDDTAGVTHIASSDGFPEVDKELVKILHGDDILDAAKLEGAGSGGAESSPLVRLAEDLDRDGIRWHHHMHFPDCVFNPHAGKWAISIERDDGPVADESYADEPVDVLRALEVLYFRNLESRR